MRDVAQEGRGTSQTDAPGRVQKVRPGDCARTERKGRQYRTESAAAPATQRSALVTSAMLDAAAAVIEESGILDCSCRVDAPMDVGVLEAAIAAALKVV